MAVPALSDRVSKFVRYLAQGIKICDASLKAGYSDEVEGYRILDHPAVAEALRKALAKRLETDLAPRALKTAGELLDDKQVGGPTRAAMVKIILDRAGFVPPSQAPAAVPKELASMSADDLRAVLDKHEAEIRNLEAELAARAAPVNAPNGRATSPEALDLLD